jgi:hypothetical protein
MSHEPEYQYDPVALYHDDTMGGDEVEWDSKPVAPKDKPINPSVRRKFEAFLARAGERLWWFGI